MTCPHNTSPDTPPPPHILNPNYSHRGGRVIPHPGIPDPATWDRPRMRDALRCHNFTRVYQLLQHEGYSQQHIGHLTGQTQPEVSAIIHGRRIIAYHLIARIALGLRVPPGHVGVCWCNCQPAPTTNSADGP
jgi:hypothetical protein